LEDFLNRLKKEINKGITVVSAKSKEMMDTAKINNQITELTDHRNRLLMEIGQLVYLMSLACGTLQETPSDDETGDRTAQISEKCEMVAELEQQIEAREVELKKLKTDTQESLGKAICESCGAAMDVDVKFCSNCGARMVKVEK
jgi:NADH pyrophosphatase NudC (nudix superfamily)